MEIKLYYLIAFDPIWFCQVDGYAATVVEKMLAKVPKPKNASSAAAINTVVDKMLFNFRNIGTLLFHRDNLTFHRT